MHPELFSLYSQILPDSLLLFTSMLLSFSTIIPLLISIYKLCQKLETGKGICRISKRLEKYCWKIAARATKEKRVSSLPKCPNYTPLIPFHIHTLVFSV